MMISTNSKFAEEGILVSYQVLKAEPTDMLIVDEVKERNEG